MSSVSTTNISGTDHDFGRPLRDGGLSVSLPRHFVPGYYHAVPPGQIHSSAEALLKLTLMGARPYRVQCRAARCDMGLPAHTSHPLSRLFACFAGPIVVLIRPVPPSGDLACPWPVQDAWAARLQRPRQTAEGTSNRFFLMMLDIIRVQPSC